MNNQPSPTQKNIWLIWFAGVMFLLFQFLLQLSSGVVIGTIMSDYGLTPLEAGVIASAFYYMYTGLQIPVGLMFDRFNARHLLLIHACLCTLGCALFTCATTFNIFIAGRLLMGWGAAYAFVGLAHLLRQYFPLSQFAFMIGLSETLGFSVSMSGTLLSGWLIPLLGWKAFMFMASIAGLSIIILMFVFIPSTKPKPTANQQIFKQLHIVLSNGTVWVNGLFSGLGFSIITVFAAMWLIPFLEIKLHISTALASIGTAAIYMGAAISCPLFGFLSNKLQKRKPLLATSCILTFILLSMAIYLPIYRLDMTVVILFFSGLSCGAYLLSFTIANDLVPASTLSTCTGMTNTLSMLTAPVFQILIGAILEYQMSYYHDALLAYNMALAIIPLSWLLALLLLYFLPERTN